MYVPTVDADGVITPLPSMAKPAVLVIHVELPEPPTLVMIGEIVPAVPVHNEDGE